MSKIEVVSYETGHVVKVIDTTGKSERQINRIDDGLNRNMGEKFYTKIELDADTRKDFTTYADDEVLE